MISLPFLVAISRALSSQIPLVAISSVSPGATKFKIMVSMPAFPDALTASTNLLRVWKRYWMPARMSLKTCKRVY